jgi:dihydrofolate reductase
VGRFDSYAAPLKNRLHVGRFRGRCIVSVGNCCKKPVSLPAHVGRRSDEWFAARWRSRSGEWADRLNSLPKYVVSSTLEDPKWTNSTVLKGDVVSEVSKLKQELNGEIVVYASTQLVHTLIEHDLVDELRLMIYPVVLGAGERLFGETSDKKTMKD